MFEKFRYFGRNKTEKKKLEIILPWCEMRAACGSGGEPRRSRRLKLGLIFMELARKKPRVFLLMTRGASPSRQFWTKSVRCTRLHCTAARPSDQSTTLKSWQSETLLPACLTQGTYRAGITLFLGCVYINLEKKVSKLKRTSGLNFLIIKRWIL